jgi:hypothetical protein
VRKIIVEQKICPQCGKTFEAPKIAKFCSKLCANKASYQRHAKDVRKRRVEKYHAEKKATGKK